MSEIDPPRDSALHPPREKVSLVELAWTFNHIALASFGGGLSAWSREVLVVEKQWMGEAEFLSAMTMCRMLPGANQVNMAVFAGSKMRGLLGAAAALFGLCLMPVLLFAAAFVLNGILRWPLPVVLAILAPITWSGRGQKSSRRDPHLFATGGLVRGVSLLSIGGGNAVLPEMHLQTVKGHHWMTDSQFADIFSISQTAPGPSILIVTLIGYVPA